MPESLVARKFFNVTPPRAYASAPGPIGEPVVLAVSGTPGALDLRSFSQPAYNIQQASTQNRQGAVGNYLNLYAETADLGLIFGVSFASVTGANAPVLATVGTVSGVTGVYTSAVGVCIRIPAGTIYEFVPQEGVDLFMGFVGSVAGIVRLWQSSPSNA